MQLTGQQKRAFRELGYTVLRGAIPQVMIDDALRAINHSLGYEGMAKDDLPRLRAQSYCNEVQKTSPITDLMNRSPVLPMVESLLGEGNLQEVGAGQIALRFPIEPSSDPGPPHGHLDGLGSGLNGSAKGSYNRGFTALAVILLSELKRDFAGNFTVWPRSHTFFQSYFKEHGHEVLEEGMPRVALPEGPVMLQGQPGDVVLTHHQLVHTAAPNASPHVRYAAIFRLRHKDCAEIGRDAYTDIWREWPGIRALDEESVEA